jgi:DNA-binding CsgD family transcriptional regulator
MSERVRTDRMHSLPGLEAERFAAASDLPAISDAIADSCDRLVPFGNLVVVLFEPRVTETPYILARSKEVAPEWLARRFPEILLAIERDLGGLEFAISAPKTYDYDERFPPAKFRETGLYRDHWNAFGVHRQLVGPLRHSGELVGYFALGRSRSEVDFSEDDPDLVEAIRLRAERALTSFTSLGSSPLATTIDTLAQVFPYPAFLMGSTGRLEWMSDEGALRLSIESARFSSALLVRGNRALEVLLGQARILLADPSRDVEPTLRSLGILRAREQLAVRWFSEDGRRRLLLAFVSAAGELRGATQRMRPLPGLGAVQSKVASLAAAGHSVLNIALQLGVSEATIRTHLRRVYLKLGVHGRAELAQVLLAGS